MLESRKAGLLAFGAGLGILAACGLGGNDATPDPEGEASSTSSSGGNSASSGFGGSTTSSGGSSGTTTSSTSSTTSSGGSSNGEPEVDSGPEGGKSDSGGSTSSTSSTGGTSSTSSTGSTSSTSSTGGTSTSSTSSTSSTGGTSTSSSTGGIPPGGTAGCGKAVTPGHSNNKIIVNGVERRYLKDVPSGVTPTTKLPIIMGFHGGSDTAENARAYMKLTSPQPVLYIYPQAPYWPEAGGVGWNVDPSGVDFPYVDQVLAELKNKHCIDTNRIFATGKSNGGFFVSELGCRRPNDFRAIAPVAGGGPSTTQCAQTVGFMVIHGTADTAVTIDKGQWTRDYWRQKNTCQATTSSATPSPCIKYNGCKEPVLWCEHSGAHIWPAFAGAGVPAFFLGL